MPCEICGEFADVQVCPCCGAILCAACLGLPMHDELLDGAVDVETVREMADG